MRATILIVDDLDINRELLKAGFEDSYDILEAENGREALDIIDRQPVDAVLLDLVMPVMSGVEVLRHMNESGKILHIPVFVVTAENNAELLMEPYKLGAVDVITKPYFINFVQCRVSNMIELYRHRNDLEDLVKEQVQQLNKMNLSMIEALATIIEFRDCESGEHVQRICGLTKILMNAACEMYPEYRMPKAEIDKIVMASILHDVGKIAIPDSILQKPGRLTKEEFEIMKEHTVRGCEMLQKIPDIIGSGIYDYSYDICRHHHERWDGKGYPDGLKGDEISIWSQVVAVADVYDALISPRVYKAPFSHEEAVRMICNGECGTFNPKIINIFNHAIGDARRG